MSDVISEYQLVRRIASYRLEGYPRFTLPSGSGRFVYYKSSICLVSEIEGLISCSAFEFIPLYRSVLPTTLL